MTEREAGPLPASLFAAFLQGFPELLQGAFFNAGYFPPRLL